MINILIYLHFQIKEYEVNLYYLDLIYLILSFYIKVFDTLLIFLVFVEFQYILFHSLLHNGEECHILEKTKIFRLLLFLFQVPFFLPPSVTRLSVFAFSNVNVN